MASNDPFQHINHFKELMNIDNKTEAISNQLDIVLKEVDTLAKLMHELKQHSVEYRRFWKQQNFNKLEAVLEKCKNIDSKLEFIQK